MKSLDVLDLRPTQFVLGMKEIEYKVETIAKFSKKEWELYRDDHVIPVVKGPRKQIYMIDHHHFARACWELGLKDFKIEVKKDLTTYSPQQFWNFMIRKEWTYLHDQFGMGPHSPEALPADVRCMADDPYRSLAWTVREEKGFNKADEIPFFEFRWAAFYRQNLGLTLHSKSDFSQAIQAAKKISRSKDAAHLPGYCGKRAR